MIDGLHDSRGLPTIEHRDALLSAQSLDDSSGFLCKSTNDASTLKCSVNVHFEYRRDKITVGDLSGFAGAFCHPMLGISRSQGIAKRRSAGDHQLKGGEFIFCC